MNITSKSFYLFKYKTISNKIKNFSATISFEVLKPPLHLLYWIIIITLLPLPLNHLITFAKPQNQTLGIKLNLQIQQALPYPISILPIPSSSSYSESDATFCRLNSCTNSSKSYSSLEPIICGGYLSR